MRSAVEIVADAGGKKTPQHSNNRRHFCAVRRRKRGLGILYFGLICSLICECQGESAASLESMVSLAREFSLNGSSAVAKGNHTTPSEHVALANENHTTPSEVAAKQSPDLALSTRKNARKKKASKVPANLASSSKRQGILRIQREWRDAINAGIAYDWAKGQPRGKSPGSSHLWIGPIGSSLFTWHFTFTGLPGSIFENGVYHGRIVLPLDYPSSPPRIMMLTPSGRFIPGYDICLSASSYHPETWQPNVWSLRTIVESLRLHMCTAANEIGGINDSFEKRLIYAQASRHWEYEILSKNQIIKIDHKLMLARGILPNSEETKIAEDSDILIESDAIDKCYAEQDVEASVGEYTSSIVQYRSRRRKRSRRKSLKSKSDHTFLRVIRQTLTSPLRMSLLAFVLLFLYLNL